MNSQNTVQTLIQWGQYIASDWPYQDNLRHRVAAANGWFTPASQLQAMQAIIEDMLQPEQLEQWMSRYQDRLPVATPGRIGLVLAGNLPLVGFHDVLSVLASGHTALVKMSSKDNLLLPYLLELLKEIDASVGTRVQLADKLTGFDAVIATGSNNSSRYFDYYFRDVPHIIRKNRHSVAVLSGEETTEDLKALGHDVFDFFGLGCRNVSKIYVPQGYDLTQLLDAWSDWQWLSDHHKWKNNYEYIRSVLLLNKEPHLATDFVMLKEATPIATPLTVVHVERYASLPLLEASIAALSEEIQVIVSNQSVAGALPFGNSQRPQLWDYADGVDTMQFLGTYRATL